MISPQQRPRLCELAQSFSILAHPDGCIVNPAPAYLLLTLQHHVWISRYGMGEARDIAMELAEALGIGEAGKGSVGGRSGSGAGEGGGASEGGAGGSLPPPIEGAGK